MKQVLFVVLIALLTLVTVQTTQARVWELGGTAAYEQRFGIWDDSNIYPFRGHIGTFINPNMTIGSILNVGITDDPTFTQTEIELGPRVSYYFEKNGFGYPFAWSFATYGHIMNETPTLGKYTDGHFTLSLGGGYMYLLNQYNGINLNVYFEQHWYDFYTYGWDTGQKIGVGFGLLFWIY